ncbi:MULTISPECIES: ammonium transporter [Candidatus Nitrosocaldus]|jgi:Amt family ammonium transporter|uniref:Ammonium transporter n=1 Tax=Candidatus Nitrosocaldus cavascurensis TaxID=2058097 RepID=A0A2K5AQD1_9ARCH|nr:MULTISPECIES: ammonium transporter [Candidatus Nitrosocaldus]SPC33853.1 Ammonium transporter [Candidatus Nitrosocaldus cavascurensis]
MNRISLIKRVLLITAVAVPLIVGLSMNQVFGQFGELRLPKPEEITEYHCSGNPLPCIDPGDTAFMYTAAALVMIMTPGGVGFLYGGLTRRKNAATVILQAFLVYAIVSIQWVIWGYSLTFGPDATGHGFIGSFDWVGLNNVLHNAPADVYAPSIPHIAFVMFQLMFAAITPALAVAGYADRVKMSAFMIHVVLWSTFVYDFVGHWNWSLGSQGTSIGWLAALGALDFAGGTVIHITSGFAGLASAMYIGRRIGYGKVPFTPHSIPFVLLGATLLWFGWFGFNPGSAGAAGALESQAFQNTNVATAVAALWWMFLSWAHTGKTSAVGAASGAIAGLVAITPASGFVGTWASIIIGFAAGTICFYCLLIKNRGRIDDALDTWPIHGMGGVVGALLTGTFAEKRINPVGDDGIFFGNPMQLAENAAGAAAAAAWAFGITLLIWKIQDVIWPGGVRVTPREEEIGLDIAQVGEKAYAEE